MPNAVKSDSRAGGTLKFGPRILDTYERPLRIPAPQSPKTMSINREKCAL